MLSEPSPTPHAEPHVELNRLLGPVVLYGSAAGAANHKAFSRLEQACRDELIPAEVIPLIRDAARQVITSAPSHIVTCLSAIAMLAEWPKSSAAEKWTGLRRLTDAAATQTATAQSLLLSTFYDACSSAEHPETINEAFRYAEQCTASNADQFVSCLLMHRSPLQIPPGEEGIRVAQTLPLLLTRCCLQQGWNSGLGRISYRHPLPECLPADTSGNITLEGYLARETLLRQLLDSKTESSSSLRKINSALRAIASGEKVASTLRVSGDERQTLLNSPHRKALLDALKHLQKSDQEELLKLYHRAATTHTALAPVLVDAITVYSPGLVPGMLAKIDQFEKLNLGLPLSVLLCSTLKEPYERAKEVVFNHLESLDPLHEMLRALVVFSNRVERISPGSAVTALTSGLHRIAPDQGERTFTLLAIDKAMHKLTLCLQGRGLPDSEAISSLEALSHFLSELESRTEIADILRLPADEQESAQTGFSRRFSGDNPPFSLNPDINPHTEEMQTRFQNQVDALFIGREDPYFGFWANTYSMKHTPIGRRCSFDEFAMAVNGELSVLPANDINRFPGRGRILENIDIETIFNDSYSPQEWRDLFEAYGPLKGATRSGNVHAIDNLPRARFTMLRAFDGTAVPSNRFFDLDGVPVTLICSNHHFDATGIHEMSLVPTEALDSFFNPVKVPYNPYEHQFPEAGQGDVSVNPPTLRAINARAREMKLPFGTIEVTSGSCFTGGFCNGPAVGSRGYHSWERHFIERRSSASFDAFGHVHKFHIKDQPRQLERLLQLHEQIYEITLGLLHTRNMYKFALGMDARGTIQRYRTHADEDTRSLRESGIMFGARTLKLFCEFTSEYRQMAQRERAPALIIAPMKDWAAEADTPLVLDGSTGYAFHSWGKPFELGIDDGQPSEETISWWMKHVDPYLAGWENKWSAPRLVARDNFKELMKEYAS